MPKGIATQLASEFESVAVVASAAAKLQAIVRGVSVSPKRFHTALHHALGAMMAPINAISNFRRSFGCGCERLSVPVVSVGNLTYGGSGKSPFCRWLARRCIEEGFKVGIVLPSYGALGKRCSTPLTEDELLEHLHYLPHLQIAMGRRREVAARHLIEKGCNLILLDDGFQYRLLYRDLDIVLVDALHELHSFCPMLREPPGALKRADIVCLAKASAARMLIGDWHLERLMELIKSSLRLGELVMVDFTPVDLVRITTLETLQLGSLAGAKVVGVVGTAEPYSFFFTLQQLGVSVSRLFIYEDHHQYSPDEVLFLCEAAHKLGAAAVVTTLKDAMKLRGIACSSFGFHERLNSWYAVRIDACVSEGAWVIERAVSKLKSNWLRGENS